MADLGCTATVAFTLQAAAGFQANRVKVRSENGKGCFRKRGNLVERALPAISWKAGCAGYGSKAVAEFVSASWWR